MPATPHILIAHDHDAMRSLLVDLVGQIYPAATITAVADGAAALAAYQHHGAELLITNGHMPKLSGTDLIRALRAQQAACPILMVSTDDTIQAVVLAMGANAFLRAPFSESDLRQALNALLSD